MTDIDNYAFSGCSGLTSVTIPNSVTSIGYSAFSSCSSLTSITIANSVTYIGWNAFHVCTSLSSIVVESGNPTYDSRNDCNALIETATNTLVQGCKNTIIPKSVTSIGSSAFEGCSGLTSVTIPNSVVTIDYWAFSGCNITSLEIPDGVTEIGYGAFCSCEELTSVIIPKTLVNIGDSAFSHCRALTDVYSYIEDIDSITMGRGVFEGDTLVNLYVPASALEAYLSTEPWNKFSNISPLPPKEIVSNGIYYSLDLEKEEATVIFHDSYFDITGRLSIPESVEYNGITCIVTEIADNAFLYCNGLTALTLGNNVQTIGSQAFMGCSGITNLIIPQSVTSIAPDAFTDCSGLTNIMVKSGNPVYDSRGNCNAVIDSTGVLVLGCKNTIVPDDVKAIASCAFTGCTGLTIVSIPEGVTNIGESAFSGCKGLTEVYCYAKDIPVTEAYVFNGVPTASATLYVPFVALDNYKATAPWNKFGTIEVLPGDDTAVTSIWDVNGKILDCYDLNGQKQSQLQKGLNLIRMNDGTVKKVMIK